MLIYPEEPISPLPDPEEGMHTLQPTMPYTLGGIIPPRDPATILQGSSFAVSLPYCFPAVGEPGKVVFQGFVASVSDFLTGVTWWEAPPLNIPQTWDEAFNKPMWEWFSYTITDNYTSAFLPPLGWTSPDVYSTIYGLKSLHYPIYFQSSVQVLYPFAVHYFLEGNGYRYYALFPLSSCQLGAIWYQHKYITPRGGSFIPLLPALMGPFLPLVPFLLPLACAFPVMPLIGLGDGGAYGAGSSTSTSAGRRSRRRKV